MRLSKKLTDILLNRIGFSEIIFCEKSNDKYIPVENKRILKKLNKEFPEIKIKDIV